MHALDDCPAPPDTPTYGAGCVPGLPHIYAASRLIGHDSSASSRTITINLPLSYTHGTIQDWMNVPYNLGPSNQYNDSSTYLSPYDWLYGPYAPPFVLENFDDLAFDEV